MKTLLFIYNPHSGKAKMAARLHEITEVFQNEGYLVTTYATTGPQDATRAARELAGDYDHVVCAGGDGTLNEVVSGLMDGGYQGALGYLPAGSTNDFSRTLHLPTDPVEAAKVAVTGQPVLCDVGRFNHSRFVYVAAFGLFTAVSYETPQEFKNLFGHTAYVLAGIRSLTDVTPYRLRLRWDGGELEDTFIYGAVSNSTRVGGFRGMLSDQVVLDDGLFEVMLVKKPTSLPQLNAIIAALLKGQPNDNVIAFQTGEMEIQSADEIPWTLDGENGGRHCLVHIGAYPGAVRLMTQQ
ncbi:MAG: diacylglycerol kinase family lipid kinase [Clostridiales bacterium]|nr:diacylglycerol kinase family lipid kinase [Clostridiales bacterium]